MEILINKKLLEKKRDEILTKAYMERTFRFLASKYNLRYEDCQDVFSMASFVLYQQIDNGEIDEKVKVERLYNYFIGICCNKAHEVQRKDHSFTSDSMDLDTKRGYINVSKANKVLSVIEENEERKREKQEYVQEVVRHLPNPCNKILTGFYGLDGESMSIKMLMEKYKYKTESAVKMQKHRCSETFREKYQKFIKSIL